MKLDAKGIERLRKIERTERWCNYIRWLHIGISLFLIWWVLWHK